MPRGLVKWFNSRKGFGFIVPDGGGPDVFVHVSALRSAKLHALCAGQYIECELSTNSGRPCAVNLRGRNSPSTTKHGTSSGFSGTPQGLTLRRSGGSDRDSRRVFEALFAKMIRHLD